MFFCNSIKEFHKFSDNPSYRVNKGITFREDQRFGMKQSQFVGKRQLSSDEIPIPGNVKQILRRLSIFEFNSFFISERHISFHESFQTIKVIDEPISLRSNEETRI